MQFHHCGYVSGDPRRQPAAGVGIDRPADLPEQVDVLIVGTGPAGMITAAQLSQFPGITTRIVERREGRLEVGHADGLQARSLETFQAFGFADRLAAEAHHVTEFAFWQPDPADPSRIARAGRAPDDPNPAGAPRGPGRGGGGQAGALPGTSTPSTRGSSSAPASRKYRQTAPPMTAPRIGATQKSHSCGR